MSSLQTVNVNTDIWDHHHGRIHAARGGWVIGEAVHNQGYSMLDDLVGHTTFFQVLVLNTVGRLPERRLADWLEALFICLSWPDSRIWCNQVGALAGTAKASPAAAVAAAIQASDSRMYGPGCMAAACNFITTAMQQKNEQGASPTTVVALHPKRQADGTPIIPGYARPVATGDERIAAMERTTKDLGMSNGEHLGLAYAIEKALFAGYGETMNLAGYGAAFLIDQGFSVQEVSRLLSCWVMSGAHACYAEAADRPPETFFPLHCTDIDYQGHPPRSVPVRG